MARIFFDANTGLLELLGLQEKTTGDYINSATVTYDIQKPDGTSVDSGSVTSLGALVSVTRDIDGVSVTFPDGNYRAVIPETITWATKPNGKFERHTVIVTADDGVNRDGEWEQEVPVSKRDFSE
jgi:hypothetical protein